MDVTGVEILETCVGAERGATVGGVEGVDGEDGVGFHTVVDSEDMVVAIAELVGAAAAVAVVVISDGEFEKTDGANHHANLTYLQTT